MLDRKNEYRVNMRVEARGVVLQWLNWRRRGGLNL